MIAQEPANNANRNILSRQTAHGEVSQKLLPNSLVLSGGRELVCEHGEAWTLIPPSIPRQREQASQSPRVKHEGGWVCVEDQPFRRRLGEGLDLVTSAEEKGTSLMESKGATNTPQP